MDADGIEHYPLFCAAFIDEMVDPGFRKLIDSGGPWVETDDKALWDLIRSGGPVNRGLEHPPE